jgi:hypothetical protein
MTVFVFTVPLAMGRLRVAVPARAAIGVGLSLVAAGLLAMHGRSVGSSWEALLPGLVLAGVGIGLANRAIGATAIAVVHPSRAGMASGFNNACRLGGIAVGIAALGTVFEHRIAASFHGAGHAHLAAATVASAWTRAADAMPVAGRAAAAPGGRRLHLGAERALPGRGGDGRMQRGRGVRPHPGRRRAPGRTGAGGRDIGHGFGTARDRHVTARGVSSPHDLLHRLSPLRPRVPGPPRRAQ